MNYNAIDILLTEDNINDAELAIRELRKLSQAFNIVHVRNGEEAMDFLFGTGQYAGSRDLKYQPRLVLLDIQMPKINGLEVLERIKSTPLTRQIPVVVLTSSREHPDIRQCYALGVNSYIVKPVGFTEFSEVIRSVGQYWLIQNQSPC